MSQSVIDRFYSRLSVPRDSPIYRSPITRSLGSADTSGFIPTDAVHWAIEPMLPISSSVLSEYLLGRGELDAKMESRFRHSLLEIENILRQRGGTYHTEFLKLYSPLDPDRDTQFPRMLAGSSEMKDATAVVALCKEILHDAGYRELKREEIEECVGIASLWGVPLHVDFELFDELAVFARGDVVGTKMRRRMRKLYRPEPVEVPIYQRMVVMFALRDDDKENEDLVASALHLRLFKNIPKVDVDMLLPGAKVRISKVDRVKIIAPSLGGFLMSLRKIAQFLLIFAAITIYSTAFVFAILVAILGYVIKSILSYFQTKNRYLLNLTRNLYYQKLDTNAGVAYHVIQQAQQQTACESMLAYYAIATEGSPISTRRLTRKCERIVREAIQVEVAFRGELALTRLCDAGQIEQRDDMWSLR